MSSPDHLKRPTAKEGITRRKLLVNTAFGAAGFATGGFLAEQIVTNFVAAISKKETGKLPEDLKEYAGLYDALNDWYTSVGFAPTFPPFTTSSDNGIAGSDSIYYALQYAAGTYKGTLSADYLQHEVDILSRPWGDAGNMDTGNEQKGRKQALGIAAEEARKKLEKTTVKVKMDQQNPDDSEVIRWYRENQNGLHNPEEFVVKDMENMLQYVAANIIPGAMCALPQDVRIIADGGEFNIGGFVELRDFLMNPELSFVTIWHEAMHAIQYYWRDYTNCLPKAEFINYLTVLIDNNRRVMEDYFSQDWPDVRDYKLGQPLVSLVVLNLEGGAYTNESIENLEQALSQYGINTNQFSNRLTADERKQDDEDPNYRLNRLISIVGRKYMQLQKQSTHTPADNKFLADPNVITLIQLTTGDINHFFVGPPQGVGGGLLCSTPNGIDHPDTFYMQKNLEVFLAQAAAFSNVSMVNNTGKINSDEKSENLNTALQLGDVIRNIFFSRDIGAIK